MFVYFKTITATTQLSYVNISFIRFINNKYFTLLHAIISSTLLHKHFYYISLQSIYLENTLIVIIYRDFLTFKIFKA